MAPWRALTPWVALALAACFAPVYDAPLCGPDDSCPEPLVCQAGTCVAPAIDAGVSDAVADGALDGPGCTARCERRGQADVAITCVGAEQACPLGCSIDGGVHCQALVPSNGVRADDLLAVEGDLTLEADARYLIDTASGAIRRYPADGSGVGAVVRTDGEGLVAQLRFRTTPAVGTAPGLAVLGVRSLTIPATTVLRPIGARALVIVASGAIVIDGEIDVGAGRGEGALGLPVVAAAGSGGGRGCTNANLLAQGCAPGGTGAHANGRDLGGGGGGFVVAGGRGGPSGTFLNDGGVAVAQALLGMMCPQTALVPLRGGSGGGCGFAGDDGGGGGGALQLTSMVSIAVNGGTLYAGGAGGAGSSSRGGGGGAGAGGGILLEAPVILIDGGRLITSGGGGGDGAGLPIAGDNARRTGAVALGSGNGGQGATGLDPALGEVLATAGGRPSTQGQGTGGGGGGAGLVHLRSIAPATVLGGVIRPAPGTSMATVR